MPTENDKPIILGIDAEWQISEDKMSNNILSYQWYGISTDGEWSGIHYTVSPHHQQSRITMSKWLSLAVMDGLSSGAISGWPRAMIVVSHYSVAELTALKDFTDLKNKFDNVQKTFVSISETFNCTLYDNSRNPKPVTLRLLDTLLLVPGQSRGLEALGDLHNIPKVELGRESKSNMLGLLHTDPELFKRYAIRDAVSNVSALGTH